MTTDQILPLIMRWMHILSAILGVGGTTFVVLVLRPMSAKVLAPEQQEALRHAVMKRWKVYFHPLILLFLVSGFYNYLMVTRLVHEDQPLYHALFGVKFLLALAVFAIAIVATSTMAWSEKIRQGNGIWALLILVMLAVVMIGGVMKTLPTTP